MTFEWVGELPKKCRFVRYWPFQGPESLQKLWHKVLDKSERLNYRARVLNLVLVNRAHRNALTLNSYSITSHATNLMDHQLTC